MCDRCYKDVKSKGYRLWMRRNSDTDLSSMGWFLCNKCCDELAVWLGEYDSEQATGGGPIIIEPIN